MWLGSLGPEARGCKCSCLLLLPPTHPAGHHYPGCGVRPRPRRDVTACLPTPRPVTCLHQMICVVVKVGPKKPEPGDMRGPAGPTPEQACAEGSEGRREARAFRQGANNSVVFP